jgi:hypothetical protein
MLEEMFVILPTVRPLPHPAVLILVSLGFFADLMPPETRQSRDTGHRYQ